MGAAVSVKQQNEVPFLLDRKTFYEVTGNNFDSEAYDCFVDHDGFVSKDRLVEVASNADCYLSHDWGLDESARGTHDRVLRIGKYLTSKGLFIATDNGPGLNRDIGEDFSIQIEKRIKKSQCVLVCITKRYCEMIAQSSSSIVKEEFYNALSSKGSRFMLPILMESCAKLSPNNTIDVLYDLFKNKYTVDCSDFDKKFTTRRGLKNVKIYENIVLDDLYDCILKTIKPLRRGGSYVAQAFIRENTVPGRHYTWLKTYLPQFDHVKCLKYSSVFTDAGVNTSTKLFHLIQCDDQYLLKLGVNAVDAKLIYKKLHDDIVGNMNAVAALKIDAIIDKSDAIEQQRLNVIKKETQRTTDIAIHHNESMAMSVEDCISYEFREEWRRTSINIEFNQVRLQLFEESMEQTNQLNERIYRAQKIMFQQYCRNIDAQRTQDYIRITHITSPVAACAALRHLLLKIQREVEQSTNKEQNATMMGRSVYKDRVDVVEFVKSVNSDVVTASSQMKAIKDITNRETSNNEVLLLKYLEDVNGAEVIHVTSQQAKVRSYIQNALMNRDAIAEEDRTDTGVSDYNGNAIYNLLHEAVIVLHLINVLARDNPESRENITAFMDNSVIKLWTPLMNVMYLFNYTFDSSEILSQCDVSYHVLSAPLEGLLVMKYLAKYNPYRYSVSLRLVYLFGAANTIELCLEIVKFHFIDTSVVLLALECIAILLDNVEYYREYCTRLMSDRNNLILLLMLLKKNALNTDDGVCEFYKLRVQSVILNILGLVVRTNQFNVLLFKFHVQYIVSDGLHSCIEAASRYLSLEPSSHANAVELVELNIRLLNTLDCVYLDHSHIVTFNSTEDLKASRDALGQLTVKRLSVNVIVPWLSELLRHYKDDNWLCQYVGFTVGNVVYNNPTAKWECVKSGIFPMLMCVLTTNMSNYNVKINLAESRETVLDLLVCLSNCLFWQHDATNVVQYNNESFKYVRNGGSKKSQRFEDVSLQDTPVGIVSVVIEEGICEVIMNVFREYSTDRSLVRACLIACCKLCYRGQYEACHRLVSLGICEHIVNIYHSYWEDTDMYFLFIVLFTGLSEAHPNLVGAEKRLIKFGICKAITEGLRHNCKVSGSRKWSHLNFPFTCRICLQTCQCVHSFTKDHTGIDALKKFTSIGFQGMLLKPPQVVCEGFTLEDVDFMPQSERGHSQHYENEPISHELDECAPSAMKTSTDIAMDSLFEAGRFNRNIEYAVNPTVGEKQEVMSTLFNLFHIE